MAAAEFELIKLCIKQAFGWSRVLCLFMCVCVCGNRITWAHSSYLPEKTMVSSVGGWMKSLFLYIEGGRERLKIQRGKKNKNRVVPSFFFLFFSFHSFFTHSIMVIKRHCLCTSGFDWSASYRLVSPTSKSINSEHATMLTPMGMAWMLLLLLKSIVRPKSK
jgi:hypothetical protein